MTKDRSLKYNAQLIPHDLLRTPVPDQIAFLDRVRHVADPDPNTFVDTFYIQQGVMDCDYK